MMIGVRIIIVVELIETLPYLLALIKAGILNRNGHYSLNTTLF